MLKQLSRFMSIALVAGSLSIVSVPTAFAATATTPERAGYSAASAAMPTAGNKVLQPGQWDWYLFRSQVPLNQKKNEDGRYPGATVDATMHVFGGQGSFEVWTPNMVNEWANNQSFNPVGEGTQVYVQNTINPSAQQIKDNTMDANDIAAGKPVKGHHAILDLATADYHWQGNFPGSDNYYLIVKNNGSQPLTYSLTVTGDLVFPSQLTVAAQ